MSQVEILDAKGQLPFTNCYTLSCQPETVWTSSVSYFSQTVRTARPSGRQEPLSRHRQRRLHGRELAAGETDLVPQGTSRMPHGNQPSRPAAKAPSGLWAKAVTLQRGCEPPCRTALHDLAAEARWETAIRPRVLRSGWFIWQPSALLKSDIK